MDYLDYAKKLHVIPVWAQTAANISGYLTPVSLYAQYKPFVEQVALIHATVGTNTLPYFAGKVDAQWKVILAAGSIRDGRQVCAHQLIPKDDYTIFDMVPAGYGCGHCNPGIWRSIGTLNYHSRGYELENLQDNNDPFTDSQYIKLALTIAYHNAVAHVTDTNICTHWDASMGAMLYAGEQPSDAHRDPYSGPFSPYEFYKHLSGIRANHDVFAFWNIPYWDGS